MAKTQKVQKALSKLPPDFVLYIDAGVQCKSELSYNAADYAIGDADGKALGESYVDLLDEIHPSKKDSSDLSLGLGFITNKFAPAPLHLHCYGFWGGRYDHQLANMGEFFRWSEAHPLSQISWHSPKKEWGLFGNAPTKFYHQGRFSLFSYLETEFSLQGQIEYELDNQTLRPLSSHGLSNIAHGEFDLCASSPYLIIFSE